MSVARSALASGEPRLPPKLQRREASVGSPEPEGATVDGRAVTVTFDEDLVAVGEADGLHWSLTVTGDGVEQHPVRASASGRTVTARLGSGTPARAGRTCSVGYFGGGLLEGAAGAPPCSPGWRPRT